MGTPVAPAAVAAGGRTAPQMGRVRPRPQGRVRRQARRMCGVSPRKALRMRVCSR